MTKTEKISAVYKITNTITGDLYIGSSKDVKKRWLQHKYQSVWKLYPNNPLYQNMQKYGVENFRFQILCPVMPEYLKQVEQEFIELFKPTYNNYNAKGLNVERWKKTQKKYEQSENRKEYQKKYQKSEKYKEYRKEYQKEYQKSEKYKEYRKEYQKSEKGKESTRKAQKKYHNQLCSYNGETLTLTALTARFSRAGIPHATMEASKYLITTQ